MAFVDCLIWGIISPDDNAGFNINSHAVYKVIYKVLGQLRQYVAPGPV